MFELLARASRSDAPCWWPRPTRARRWRRRRAGRTRSAGSPTSSRCFRTTRSRPARSSSPTASCGSRSTPRATCRASIRWTATASSSASCNHRRARPPTATRCWCPTTRLSGSILQRLLDLGIDQFFNTANDLVVPSEGGWRVDPSGGTFIPGTRIGCFGPGGNIVEKRRHARQLLRAAGDGTVSRRRAERSAAEAGAARSGANVCRIGA